MRKTIAVFIILSMLFVPCLLVSAASAKVVVDGNVLNAQCVIVNNRTLAPVRAISEAMGATVLWDESSQKITLSKQYYETASTGTTPSIRTAYMWIGKDAGNIDGMFQVNMDVPAQIINGNTMIPVAALGQMLSADVKWDQATQTVTITSTLASSPVQARTDYIDTQNKLNNVTEEYVKHVLEPDTKDPLYPYGYNCNYGTNGSDNTIFINIQNVSSGTLPARTLYIRLIKNTTGEVLTSVPFTVKELAPNDKDEITMTDFSASYADRYRNRLVVSVSK